MKPRDIPPKVEIPQWQWKWDLGLFCTVVAAIFGIAVVWNTDPFKNNRLQYLGAAFGIFIIIYVIRGVMHLVPSLMRRWKHYPFLYEKCEEITKALDAANQSNRQNDDLLQDSNEKTHDLEKKLTTAKKNAKRDKTVMDRLQTEIQNLQRENMDMESIIVDLSTSENHRMEIVTVSYDGDIYLQVSKREGLPLALDDILVVVDVNVSRLFGRFKVIRLNTNSYDAVAIAVDIEWSGKIQARGESTHNPTLSAYLFPKKKEIKND